jgi:tRNA(His) 5'-end guanylyltransferase
LLSHLGTWNTVLQLKPSFEESGGGGTSGSRMLKTQMSDWMNWLSRRQADAWMHTVNNVLLTTL